jgi:hypothetical protein
MALRLGFIVNPGETNCKVSEVKHVNGNIIGHSCGVVSTRWRRMGIFSLARLEKGRWAPAP